MKTFLCGAVALGTFALGTSYAGEASAQPTQGEMYIATATGVYEFSAGGDMSGATPFAFGFTGSGESLCIGPGGDLFLATSDGKVWNITAGGDFTLQTAFAFDIGTALQITCNATEIKVANPTNGAVYDVTAGGSFALATPFASGLDNVFAVFRDSAGTLWADSGPNSGAQEIHNITAGGDFSAAVPFATLNPAYMIGFAQRGATRIISSYDPGRVIDFTAGGNLAAAPNIATGPGPVSVLDAGAAGLYVSDFDLEQVFEISALAGGDYSATAPFAFNFPSFDLAGMVLIGIVSVCGNGTVEAGETCDTSGESATCDDDCTAVACGDGNVNTAAAETCDEMGETATCDDDCTAPTCGDGNANAAAGELCDTAGESATCNTDCTPAACGDTIINATAGETCDDGNVVSGDGCSSTCTDEGAGGMGGNPSTGGMGGNPTSSGGMGGNGGTGNTGAGASNPDDDDDGGDTKTDSGCSCHLPGHGTPASPLALLTLALGIVALRRRRA
jgi:MYXO-CTERM domain-containing protein